MNTTEFLKAAMDSGIVSPEFAASCVTGEAKPSSEDVESLAGSLVASGKMTAFQAAQIRCGKATELSLGPYLLLDELGTGGMGAVYRAEHRTMRRTVALKVIKGEGLKSPAAVRRFEREVQAAARLEHPNVVTAHDAGEASGTHYLVMQLVDGRSLSQVVKENGPQPVGRVADWILQTAKGLAYAHGKGVVHRDIKPGNLLIDSEGTVKILDMGLARLETLDADQDQLTGTGQIMGTVDYMAPEQAVDTRQADARADIYSLGATLWYLLTGRPLFPGDTAMSKMLAHMQAPTPSLTSVRGDIPPEFERLFQRMVAKQPVERFQSMQEVIAALEDLPQSVATMGTSCFLVVDGTASLGSSGAAATQTRQRHKVAVANENTATFGPVVIDTEPALERIKPPTNQHSFRPKPLHLVIVGGAVGALLLVGLIVPAFSGRRDPGRNGQAGDARGGPFARSAPRSSTPPPAAIAPFDGAAAREHQESWAEHLGVPVETTNSIGQTLVLIPPGRFAMGEGDSTVLVTLARPYRMGQTEVTQAQWRRVMGTAPWAGLPAPSGDHVAATMVRWPDAVAFCERLTAEERTGGMIRPDEEYRLPSEAEWEYACRAGTVTAYSFGEDPLLLGDYGWYGGDWDGEKRAFIPGGNTGEAMYAHEVRLKSPNPWGLYDMHGNVGEWCSDWIENPGDATSSGPAFPPDVGPHCIRSGAWGLSPWMARSASRARQPVSHVSTALGFRICRTVVEAATSGDSRRVVPGPSAASTAAVKERPAAEVVDHAK